MRQTRFATVSWGILDVVSRPEMQSQGFPSCLARPSRKIRELSSVTGFEKYEAHVQVRLALRAGILRCLWVDHQICRLVVHCS